MRHFRILPSALLDFEGSAQDSYSQNPHHAYHNAQQPRRRVEHILDSAMSNFRNAWQVLIQNFPPKPQFSVDRVPDLSGQVALVTGEPITAVSSFILRGNLTATSLYIF